MDSNLSLLLFPISWPFFQMVEDPTVAIFLTKSYLVVLIFIVGAIIFQEEQLSWVRLMLFFSIFFLPFSPELLLQALLLAIYLTKLVQKSFLLSTIFFILDPLLLILALVHFNRSYPFVIILSMALFFLVQHSAVITTMEGLHLSYLFLIVYLVVFVRNFRSTIALASLSYLMIGQQIYFFVLTLVLFSFDYKKKSAIIKEKQS